MGIDSLHDCSDGLLFFCPNDQSYDSLNLIPFATIRYYLSGEINWIIALYNLAANIGLFIPYGIYLMTKNHPLLSYFLHHLYLYL